MINEDPPEGIEEDCLMAPLHQRIWGWFWGGGYYTGWRYWREGVYIWLGKRLPAGLVFYASNQLLDFASERGLRTRDIMEAQSDWLIDKMGDQPR